MEKGSLVEVSSEVNGVAGAWYVAKVCYVAKTCYVSRVLKSEAFGSGNGTFYLVEFQTSPKSVKYVSSNFIRPLPPTEEDQLFEVDDVVDAYHHEGWCIGKVVQQLEDPTRAYSVLLDQSSELIEFTPSELRHHVDWVDHSWVKRQKEVWTSHQEKATDYTDPTNIDESASSSGTDNVGTDMVNEDLNLSFLKDSAMMSIVESMDLFKSLPQKPHFKPLLKCEEVKREALAVAHMMTFANIVKKISKLEITSPSSDFDKLLDCLPELELNGFNVERTGNRILQLKAMKEEQERLATEYASIERGIGEQNQEIMEYQADMEFVMNDLKISCEKKRFMKEKISMLTSTITEAEMEIAKLESNVDRLQKENEEEMSLFRTVAAVPWRR